MERQRDDDNEELVLFDNKKEINDNPDILKNEIPPLARRFSVFSDEFIYGE